MRISNDKIQCWVITEGLAGTENQCIGVANALGISPIIKRVTLNQPWKTLSPYIGFECAQSFSPSLVPPWPDLLITSGRKAVAVSKYIKKQSNNRTFTVHIQDPRISSKYFDLIAVPEHDDLHGDNVIITKAAPNRITTDVLEHAKKEFPQFENIPSPRIAVLIGGNSKAYSMNNNDTRTLAKQIKAINAGLMITTSRRTGSENEKILRSILQKEGTYMWDGDGENPYFGFLAWSDFILVTADSTSMLSEAATTGKPVYMIGLNGGHKRIEKMHKNLIDSGAVRHFNGRLEAWSYEPLNDAKLVADAIKEFFEKTSPTS